MFPFRIISKIVKIISNWYDSFGWGTGRHKAATYTVGHTEKKCEPTPMRA
jgi:hypothetical protein